MGFWRNKLCDGCDKSVPTNQEYIWTTHGTVLIELCHGCNKICDNRDKVKIAEYKQVKDKLRFLKNPCEVDDD